MGTTAASLHILRATPGDNLAGAINAAYRKLGYAKARNAKTATRQAYAIDGVEFVSLHDSGNDDLDTGELKELAVAISKAAKGVAIVTTVSDSDSWEFLLFHRGKQIDAAVSDAESHTGGLTFLDDKKRAKTWASVFAQRDFLRAIASGTAPAVAAKPRDADYEKMLADAAATQGPFAETTLGAYCEVAGLAAEAPVTTFHDCAAKGEAGAQWLGFVAGKKKPATATSSSGEVLLANVFDDDDCPYHRFYPAPWPIDRSAATGLRWFVTSSGAGFRGLRVRLRAALKGDMRVAAASLVAYPFYNGQITSAEHVALHEFREPRVDGAGMVTLEAPDFEIPGPSAQSRRQIIIILRVEIAAGASGEAELAPELEVLNVSAPAPSMPVLRLVARQPSWTPVAAGASPGRSAQEAIRRLNTPSALSQLAILPGDGAAPRALFQRLFETLLDKLPNPTTVRARVHTQKHMSLTSFSVSKNTRENDLAATRADRSWPRLFDEAADYQTVLIDIFPPGAPNPRMGFLMQATLKGDLPDPTRQTLSGGVWVIDHPDTFNAFGLDRATLQSKFTDWIRASEAVQGWAQGAAWIPAFDIYDDWRRTPYEEAATTDWFRLDLNGKMNTRDWLRDRVRTIAPVIWLDAGVFEGSDVSALDEIATLARHGAIIEIRLRDGASLVELERAMQSRLPLVAQAGA